VRLNSPESFDYFLMWGGLETRPSLKAEVQYQMDFMLLGGSSELSQPHNQPQKTIR
jgi:hypothetical protein